ncbi:MAG: DUF3857 and transglutaminase domain-containing protein [Verrucomicrobia bacterium]|nr:DUF3857 and transglutaminase domain-containing protein [Cytophagales bacterium]
MEIGYNALIIPKELTANADAVLRNYEEIYEVESVGKAIHKVKRVYTILNKDGERYGEFALGYDKSNPIRVLEGRIFDAMGNQIGKLKKSDIKDQAAFDGVSFVSDARYKSAGFGASTYPYTVEFYHETSSSNLMFYPRLAPCDINTSVENASLEIIMPANLKLRYREQNLKEKVKITPLANGKTQYRWQVKKEPVLKNDKFGLEFHEKEPAVYTAPSDFEYNGYTGNMNTWENFGKFIWQLNQGRDVLPEATQAKIKEMVAGEKDEFKKIQKIYEYMQSKTRYVGIQLGIGGFQPFPAAEVDEKGYGDCKALSNYMRSLLKTVGISSHYALVRGGDDGVPVNKDFCKNSFNHAILCVPTKKDTVWLECTDQTKSAGYMGDFTGDRYALLITEKGGKLVRTPTYKQKDNLLLRSADVVIDADGNAKVNINTTYTGLKFDDYAGYADYSKDIQKKHLNEKIEIRNFNLDDFDIKVTKNMIPSATEKLSLSVGKYASKSGKRMFIAPNFINPFNFPDLSETDNRTSDIYFYHYDYMDSDTVKFHLPEKYHLEGVANEVNYQSAFGTYKTSIKIEEGLVTYIRTMTMKGGKYPKDKYKELVMFFKSINKAEKTKIVLVSET